MGPSCPQNVHPFLSAGTEKASDELKLRSYTRTINVMVAWSFSKLVVKIVVGIENHHLNNKFCVLIKKMKKLQGVYSELFFLERAQSASYRLLTVLTRQWGRAYLIFHIDGICFFVGRTFQNKIDYLKFVFFIPNW